MAVNFFIGVKALILNEERKVLILKRSKSDGLSDFWDIPGGRISEYESIREALEREITEETNLRLTVVSFPISTLTFLPKHDPTKQIVRIIYLCKALGDIKLSSEHSEFKWINPSEAVNYRFPDEEYNEVFKKLLEFKFNTSYEFLNDGMEKATRDYLNSLSKNDL